MGCTFVVALKLWIWRPFYRTATKATSPSPSPGETIVFTLMIWVKFRYQPGFLSGSQKCLLNPQFLSYSKDTPLFGNGRPIAIQLTAISAHIGDI